MRAIASALWVLCVVGVCGAASAAEFSWQLSGDRRQSEAGDAFDADGAVLSATYYFSAIDDQQGPYDFAAFLSRSSRLGITVQHDEQRQHFSFTPIFGTPTTITSVDSSSSYVLSGRYVWQSSGWYAGGAVTRGDGNPPSSTCLRQDRDLHGEGAIVGKYLGGWTSIELGWAKTDLETRIGLLCVFSPPSFTPLQPKQETNAADLNVVHLGRAGRLTYALTGRITSSHGELTFTPALLVPGSTPPPQPVVVVGGIAVAPVGNLAVFVGGRFRTYAVGGELFPTTRLGVRLDYSRWDGDPVHDHAYGIATTWFFRKNVAVRFRFARTKPRSPFFQRDQDDSSLQFIGRF